MIKISQIKIPVSKEPVSDEARMEELRARAAKALRVGGRRLGETAIVRRSIDARKRPEIYEVYTLAVSLKGTDEKEIVLRAKNKNVVLDETPPYVFPQDGARFGKTRPVVVGAGPAGYLCAYLLAERDFRPIVIERGRDVDSRATDVGRYWLEGVLNENSNVQFGEGGAGTFSDGKLYTSVGDRTGRLRAIKQIFVDNGAPKDILYEAYPHIGTDLLTGVVRRMRERIIAMGGEVRFDTALTGLVIKKGAIAGVETNAGEIETDCAVLAIGHSARDTFRALQLSGVEMEPKAFAVGLRIAHPQEVIDRAMYGEVYPETLPPAPYRLSTIAQGRSVYTFCMCPGGYIVNASSKNGALCVNGMSYRARDGAFANSAVICAVSPQDFFKGDALDGAQLQETLEKRAFAVGEGKIPLSTFGAFYRALGDMRAMETAFAEPDAGDVVKGAYVSRGLETILPSYVNRAIAEGIGAFGAMVKGFDDAHALLAGVESRTSSPVRILRGDDLQSVSVKGLFPCGEGAGYAGGIMSAALDGMRVAETIACGTPPDGRTRS